MNSNSDRSIFIFTILWVFVIGIVKKKAKNIKEKHAYKYNFCMNPCKYAILCMEFVNMNEDTVNCYIGAML